MEEQNKVREEEIKEKMRAMEKQNNERDERDLEREKAMRKMEEEIRHMKERERTNNNPNFQT